MEKVDLKIWHTRPLGSKIYVIRYVDPITRQTKQVSTKTTSKKEADRQLGVLREKLLSGVYATPSRISWEAFRDRYEDEVLSSLAEKTRLKVATVFNAVERTIAPKRLADLTAERISKFAADLRVGGREEITLAGYLAHLRSALQWASNMGLLQAVPKIIKPKRAKTSKLMKGRPITRKEFKRLLAKCPDVVGETAAAAWQHYLRGLWLSGLRLAESLELYWDDDSKLRVVAVKKNLMLRIPAALEKGNTDRLLPITPDFSRFLTKTPEEARVGRVFKLPAQKVHGERLTSDRVTRIVAAIGRAAGVVVDQPRNKFASAHDLRRSFGARWAELVMPQVLMVLMRHESINTTLRYYVGYNALRTSKLVRQAFWQARASRRARVKRMRLRDDSRDTPPKNAEAGEK